MPKDAAKWHKVVIVVIVRARWRRRMSGEVEGGVERQPRPYHGGSANFVSTVMAGER